MRHDSLEIVGKEIVARLQTAGFVAFWVGGCVRDFLLGREPGDYDIATSALPEQVEKLFPHTVAVGRKFGVMVVVEDSHQFQVATFRAEADYRDGRHPEQVTFADAQADAARRDFTVNGLFYDPVTEKLHDWVGGEKDLRARIIRTIGSPEERFAEDHLRLLRTVRFAAQLGFEIEAGTFAALKANAAKIKTISAERVRDELVKLFSPPRSEGMNGLVDEWIGGKEAGQPTAHQSSNPSIHQSNSASAARGLVLLRDSGLLEYVLPELAATISCEQSPDYHPEGSVFNHIRLMLEKLPPDAPPTLPWMVLMHDIAKPVTASRDEVTGKIHFYEHEKIGATMAEEILRRLRFSNDEIAEIVTGVRHHMQFKDVKQMRKATLRRVLLRETFPVELALHRLDCLGSHGMLDHYDFLVAAAAELAKLPAIRPPLLTGADLIELGMQPGKAMGALLHEIRERQLQDELKSPEEAKAWVKSKLAA